MKTISILAFFYTVILIINGCVSISTTAEIGEPLDVKAIQKIVIGETTKSDIFKTMGTPHSIFQNQAEFTESYSIQGYSTVQNRQLSAIDDNHYAFLYRFTLSSSITEETNTVFVKIKDTTIRIRTNELLLLFDKRTNIVDDVAYRK